MFFFSSFILLCLEIRSVGYDITAYCRKPSASLASLDDCRGGGEEDSGGGVVQ